MKAENLMIGDWVLHDGEPYQIRQLGIYGVDRDGEDYPAVCVGKPKGIGLIIERNEIEPIPLTDEFLKQNGFERVNGDYQDVFYVYDGIELLIDDGYTLFGQCKMPIKYVHELQHALRLCGINKEIEI